MSNIYLGDSKLGTRVKGSAESTYREGDVNITPANLGITVVNNTKDANKSVKYATSAGSATKATQDGSGNNIVNTYATKSQLSSYATTSQLSNYVSNSALSSTLASYATKNDLSSMSGVSITNIYDGTDTLTESILGNTLYLFEFYVNHNGVKGTESQLIVGQSTTVICGGVKESDTTSSQHYFEGARITITINSSTISVSNNYGNYSSYPKVKLTAIYKIS